MTGCPSCGCSFFYISERVEVTTSAFLVEGRLELDDSDVMWDTAEPFLISCRDCDWNADHDGAVPLENYLLEHAEGTTEDLPDETF